MSEPLSGSGAAAALGGVTVFGLFTGMDFGIVFGAFAGSLFVATIPQALPVWRVATNFIVSFIVGVLGADAAAFFLVERLGIQSKSVDALCAVLVSVLSVKVLSFIHHQGIASLLSGLFPRLRGGGGAGGDRGGGNAR
ncbi:putative holin [Escherichia coli]|uniref:putative holin n=1 Tax=Escherichia coli TaxID=562 RepID=UPI0010F21A8C|nr:putative holin [Escherichia coli]GDO96281.1 membrane protein [Escherichia coli]